MKEISATVNDALFQCARENNVLLMIKKDPEAKTIIAEMSRRHTDGKLYMSKYVVSIAKLEASKDTADNTLIDEISAQIIAFSITNLDMFIAAQTTASTEG